MSNLQNNPYQNLANTISLLSVDAIEKANSGHPGLPMGAAFYAGILWSDYLNFNPEDSNWLGRDRFVLSAGHGSMLIYSLLNLFGYKVSLDDIKNFRQLNSITPGHPEYGMTEGIEATTGPLGQGFANGVGMALSAKLLSAEYDKNLFSTKVFALVSDGDLMEGVAIEAASLAGHLGLNNLIYLYDDNKITLAGKAEVCFTDNTKQKFEALNWNVEVVSAYDEKEIRASLDKAVLNANQESGKPTLICMRSIIGKGSPKKQNSSDAHGSPLGVEETKATKKELGWEESKTFYIPEEIKTFCLGKLESKREKYNSWNKQFSDWKVKNPESSKRLSNHLNRTISEELKVKLLAGLDHTKKEATRSLSGKAIQIIAKETPSFIGGSADLESSTKTLIKESTEIQQGAYLGRNIRFGVREHGMGAIVNGLAYTKAWIPYSATFLVFSDYMRGAMRVAALSHLPALYIFTHDSFYVGEDGPTHEPIEQIQSLRAIPNLYVYRPADGLEVGACYLAALDKKNAPAALIFTRQDLEPITREAKFDKTLISKGGYVLREDSKDQLVIVATGSEVSLALETLEILKAKGIMAKIVSMPCAELFNEQPAEYRENVLSKELPVVTLEAGTTFGWSSIIGRGCYSIGIDHYGASAPAEVLAEKFGFKADKVAEKIFKFVRKS